MMTDANSEPEKRDVRHKHWLSVKITETAKTGGSLWNLNAVSEPEFCVESFDFLKEALNFCKEHYILITSIHDRDGNKIPIGRIHKT